jgi:hypothetical protein
MVGAIAASIVRWKNDSHEHAAIAIHGTHICQVTAEAAVTVFAGFTPVVVLINSPTVGAVYAARIAATSDILAVIDRP